MHLVDFLPFLAHLDKVREELLHYPGIGIGVGVNVGVGVHIYVKVF